MVVGEGGRERLGTGEERVLSGSKSCCYMGSGEKKVTLKGLASLEDVLPGRSEMSGACQNGGQEKMQGDTKRKG
jgi:hypothetical protein